MDDEATPFLVVGGGIGGMVLALALARRGQRSLVLEQAPEIGEIGAGIQLAPNGLRVLDRLGVFQALLATAVAPPAATLRDATSGEVLARLTFDDRFRGEYGYPYLVIHRSDLHSGLVDAALATGLVEIRTNSRVAGLRQDPAGPAEVALATGERLRAQRVVGADGLHSVVREYVSGGDDLVHLGDFAYRGTVPYDEIADREGKDDVTWWVGPSMHLIQYPVRGGSLINQVAVFTSDADRPDLGAPADPADFDRLLDGKHPLVAQGAALLDRQRHWAMIDRNPLGRWTRGRVTLLGDAAHPMVQYLAQGGCQALEDAACLAECVASNDDAESAFKDYESRRIPVTATVQRWARNMGAIVHAGGLMRDLRDELLRSRTTDSFPHVDRLYGNHATEART
ncbi:FAD-dependent monooxygenase [Dactylosporangium sp. CA-092794]|uniref:FAD-dependent monooxygenase n=1 Tax=Dactylosporangium sp. CA-092794 TaxID=3239929 RepID=UPI003D8E5993